MPRQTIHNLSSLKKRLDSCIRSAENITNNGPLLTWHNKRFISTRFAGQDGVSLESAKWAEVLWEDRHISYWYSGQSDRDPGISFVVPEAYFGFSEK